MDSISFPSSCRGLLLHIKMYRLRWQIETAFRTMKSAGFNMEETHLTTDGRFQNMLAIVLIAYACAFIDGLA